MKEVYKMENGKYNDLAERTIEALRKMLSSEDATDNFKSYLSYCYDVWLEKWASTSEDMTAELEHFATMYD